MTVQRRSTWRFVLAASSFWPQCRALPVVSRIRVASALPLSSWLAYVLLSFAFCTPYTIVFGSSCRDWTNCGLSSTRSEVQVRSIRSGTARLFHWQICEPLPGGSRSAGTTRDCADARYWFPRNGEGNIYRQTWS